MARAICNCMTKIEHYQIGPELRVASYILIDLYSKNFNRGPLATRRGSYMR